MMFGLYVASCILATALAAPAENVLPTGLDSASCPNYPFCGPSPLEIPDVPGAADVIRAQEQVLAQERILAGPTVPLVPGLDQHAAAEAQVLAAQAQVPNQFTGIVGASGNIGPSGLCGPSGCVAF